MNTQKQLTKQDRMIPPKVAAVLSIRDNKDMECPLDIINRIESLKIGKMVYHFKSLQQSVPTNSWRSKNREGGFRNTIQNAAVSNSWDRPTNIRKVTSDVSLSSNDESPYRRFRNSPSPADTPVSPLPPGGRYVSSIVSDKKVEDLMQDVIFTYTDLYKKFTDDADFKRQYLDFVFDKVWKQNQPNI